MNLVLIGYRLLGNDIGIDGKITVTVSAIYLLKLGSYIQLKVKREFFLNKLFMVVFFFFEKTQENPVDR